METIQGVRTKVEVVSYSHGSVRVPLAQSFNYTPRFTERTINEFDNLEAALVVTTYDGVDITFDYLDSDSKLVEAMFADVDPAGTTVVDDPTDYRKVYIVVNVKGLETGTIFASIFAKACRTKGAPYTEPVKEEARVTRDLSGTNCIKIKGAALMYQRILPAVPDAGTYIQAVPPNIKTDLYLTADTYATGYPEIPLQYDGNYYVCVLKNGVEVTTGFTMTIDTFTLDVAPDDADVWEIFYPYDDTVSESSSSSCRSSSSSSSSKSSSSSSSSAGA